MSTIQENLRIVFWIVPLCIQPLIALAIVVRWQIRSFPVFFAYTLFVSARDFVLLFVKYNTRSYSSIYFLSEPLALLLGVIVVYEAVRNLVRSYPALRYLTIRLFCGMLALAFLGGLAMLKTSEFGQSKLWIESLFLIERSARFMQVGVLIVLILFISHLGLSWKHYTSGIVAGFGIAAGLQLVLYEWNSIRAIDGANFSLLMSGSYNVAVIVWALYFLCLREGSDAPTSQLPKIDLPRWDEILRGYLKR